MNKSIKFISLVAIFVVLLTACSTGQKKQSMQKKQNITELFL